MILYIFLTFLKLEVCVDDQWLQRHKSRKDLTLHLVYIYRKRDVKIRVQLNHKLIYHEAVEIKLI